MSVVTHWKELAQAGSISTDAAKQSAIAEFRLVRYGSNKSGYFNIYDSKAIRVLNLDQKTEGTSATDLVDPSGKHIALAVIRSDAPVETTSRFISGLMRARINQRINWSIATTYPTGIGTFTQVTTLTTSMQHSSPQPQKRSRS